MKFAKLTALAGVAAALCAAPALADTPTFEFRVERASLTSEAETRDAYRRLGAEAARYCHALDLQDTNATARCRIDVVENVVQAVGHDALSLVHREAMRETMIADAR
ncbi:MAG: UrcA family protein [Oceanicaulis sp.]